MDDLISRQAVIDALHIWFRDGFDEDKWWNSTHVLAAIEGLPSAKQGYKWETCFECPLSHGCPKIKGCTNEQAIEYASQIPNDCPLSAQPDHVADVSKKVDRDFISRQAAIDALDKRFDGVPMELTTEILELRRDLRERIPSAQPATSCSEIPNSSTDCISRQAVVKFFNDWISCLDENCHHQSVADMTIIKNDFKNLPSVQPKQVCVATVALTDEQVKEAVEKAKNAVISVIELEPHWIPCGERLPEEKQSVLVTDGSVIWVCDIISTDEGYKWEDSHGYWLDLDEWIAWMPLPEPYRGGGE